MTEEMLWQSFEKIPGGCWIWKLSCNVDTGYAQVNFEGRVQKVSKVVYKLMLGPIPSGKVVCHSCDNRKCGRPSHLLARTQKWNIRDAVRKGRMVPWCKGRKHSLKTRAKMSATHKGIPSPLKGKRRSLEFREKVRAGMLDHWRNKNEQA